MERRSVLPTRVLGKTGEKISILGLGGEGVLRSYEQEKEAVSLIRRAIELGITYFETARAYAGSESYYGRALGESRKEIFLASKSHDRTREGAMRHLELSLGTLKTDHLDLWMIHDVRTMKDLDQIFGTNGAIRAFEEARRNRTARYLGISGHRNPSVISRAIDLFGFDAISIPVNAAEPHYWSFFEEVMPKALDKKIGILAIKVLSRGISVKIFGEESVANFLRFAMSQPVTSAVVGCESVSQLEANVRIAQTFEPMPEKEQEILVKRVSSYARELVYYKL